MKQHASSNDFWNVIFQLMISSSQDWRVIKNKTGLLILITRLI